MLQRRSSTLREDSARLREPLLLRCRETSRACSEPSDEFGLRVVRMAGRRVVEPDERRAVSTHALEAQALRLDV